MPFEYRWGDVVDMHIYDGMRFVDGEKDSGAQRIEEENVLYGLSMWKVNGNSFEIALYNTSFINCIHPTQAAQ